MATLVLHTPRLLVESRRERLRVTRPDGTRREVPLRGIDRVHVFGRVQVSTSAIHLLARLGKDLAYFTRRGRLRARLMSAPGHGVEVRRAQYRLADHEPTCLILARRILAAKFHNQRAVLLRLWRNRPDLTQPALLDRLDEAQRDLETAADRNALLGIEGSVARQYFERWACCVAEVFPWNGAPRSRGLRQMALNTSSSVRSRPGAPRSRGLRPSHGAIGLLVPASRPGAPRSSGLRLAAVQEGVRWQPVDPARPARGD